MKKRLPQNQKVVDLYNEGYTIAQIEELTQRSRKAIITALHSAQYSGDVTLPKNKNRSLKSLLRSADIRGGSVKVAVENSMGQDVMKWLVEEASANGYPALIDYMCDIAIDAYFAMQAR